jgi:hypothetical protein
MAFQHIAGRSSFCFLATKILFGHVVDFRAPVADLTTNCWQNIGHHGYHGMEITIGMVRHLVLCNAVPDNFSITLVQQK